MDLEKIKNLVKQNGDKFILIENGEPEIVMMSFHEYQKLATHSANIETHASTANYGYRTEAEDLEGGELRETEFIPPSSGMPSDFASGYGRDFEFFPRSSLHGDKVGGFIASVAAEAAGLPIRLEDIRLEDLPI